MGSELGEVYRDAVVRIGRRVLRVGAPAPPGLAVITAWNPGSQRRETRLNLAASALLRARLMRRCVLVTSATNAPGSAWAEPSFAVQGLPLHEVVALARAFGQRAIFATVGGRWAVVSVYVTGSGSATGAG